MGPSFFHIASETSPRRPSWYALSRHLSGWAAPPLSRTVRLSPRAVEGREIESGTLRDALERSGAQARRAWRTAVLRRAMAASVLIGLILALVDAWLGWPRWCAPVAAVVIAIIVTTVAWRRVPGIDAVARFLDHALDLKEQLATALDVDMRAPSSSAMGARLQLQATTVARRVSVAWTPRGVRGGREWAAVVVLIGGLAAAVILPFKGASLAREAGAPASGGAIQAAVTPAAGTPPLAVRVAVVSVQNGGAARPARNTRSAPAVRRAATLRRVPATRPIQTTGEVRRRNAGARQAPTSGGASANGQLPAPVLRHSESALPSGPATAGKKGAFSSSTPPNQGQARPGATGRSAGASAGAGTRATGATKSATRGGPSTGQQGANAGKGGAPGSSASSKAAPSQCLYGCTRLLPSQLTAPGLVTGKGQFAGKGLPGGQTAGHAAGAASKLGSAQASTPKTARQLTITSAYGQATSARLSTKQAQGHNGAGSAQPSVVQAGTTGGRTFDYVPPDANVQPAADDAILGRYFTPSPAS